MLLKSRSNRSKPHRAFVCRVFSGEDLVCHSGDGQCTRQVPSGPDPPKHDGAQVRALNTPRYIFCLFIGRWGSSQLNPTRVRDNCAVASRPGGPTPISPLTESIARLALRARLSTSPWRRWNGGVTQCNNNSTNPLSSSTPTHATSTISCDRPHCDQRSRAPLQGSLLRNGMGFVWRHRCG